MDLLRVTDAREKFAEAVNRVAYGGERIVIERRGKKLAALVPMSLLKVIEALEDEMDLQEALKVLEEIEKEGTVSLDEVRARLGL